MARQSSERCCAQTGAGHLVWWTTATSLWKGTGKPGECGNFADLGDSFRPSTSGHSYFLPPFFFSHDTGLTFRRYACNCTATWTVPVHYQVVCKKHLLVLFPPWMIRVPAKPNAQSCRDMCWRIFMENKSVKTDPLFKFRSKSWTSMSSIFWEFLQFLLPIFFSNIIYAACSWWNPSCRPIAVQPSLDIPN